MENFINTLVKRHDILNHETKLASVSGERGDLTEPKGDLTERQEKTVGWLHKERLQRM